MKRIDCLGLILSVGLVLWAYAPTKADMGEISGFRCQFAPVKWDNVTREVTLRYAFIPVRPCDSVLVELVCDPGVEFLGPTKWVAFFPSQDSNITLFDLRLPPNDTCGIGAKMQCPRYFHATSYWLVTTGDTIEFHAGHPNDRGSESAHENKPPVIRDIPGRVPGEFPQLDSIFGPPKGWPHEPTFEVFRDSLPQRPDSQSSERYVRSISDGEKRLIDSLKRMPDEAMVEIAVKLDDSAKVRVARREIGDIGDADINGFHHVKASRRQAWELLTIYLVEVWFLEDYLQNWVPSPGPSQLGPSVGPRPAGDSVEGSSYMFDAGDRDQKLRSK
jgi:hypothetical protein